MPTLNTSHLSSALSQSAATQRAKNEPEQGLSHDKAHAAERPASPRPPAPRIEIKKDDVRDKNNVYVTRKRGAPECFNGAIGEPLVTDRHMAYDYLFANDPVYGVSTNPESTPKIGKQYLDSVAKSKESLQQFYTGGHKPSSSVDNWRADLEKKVGYSNNALVSPEKFNSWLNDMVGQMVGSGKKEARILLSTPSSQVLSLHMKHKPGGRVSVAVYHPSLISNNHFRFENRDDEPVAKEKTDPLLPIIGNLLTGETPYFQAISPDVSHPASDLRYMQNADAPPLTPQGLLKSTWDGKLLSGYLGACEQAKNSGISGANAEDSLPDVRSYMDVLALGLHADPESPAHYGEALRHLDVFAQGLKTLGISSAKIKEQLTLHPGANPHPGVIAQALTESRQADSPIIGDYLSLLRTAGLQDPEIADVIQGDGNLALAVQSGNLPAFNTLMDHLDKLDLPAGKLATILEAKQPGQASALNQAAQHGDADMIDHFVTRIGTNPKLSDTEKMHLLQGFGSNDTTCLQSLVSTKDKAGISAYMQALKGCNLPSAMTASLLGNTKHRVPNLLEQICAHGSEHFFWSVVNDFRKALGKMISGTANTEPTQPEILAHYLQEMANLGLNGEAAHQVLLSPDSNGLTASHYVVQAANEQTNQAFGNVLDNLAPAQAVKVLEGRLANGNTTYDTAKTAGPKGESLYHGFMDKQMQRLSALFSKSDKPTSLTSTLWASSVFNQAKS